MESRDYLQQLKFFYECFIEAQKEREIYIASREKEKKELNNFFKMMNDQFLNRKRKKERLYDENDEPSFLSENEQESKDIYVILESLLFFNDEDVIVEIEESNLSLSFISQITKKSAITRGI